MLYYVYCLITYDLFVSLQIFKIYVMYKNYIYNLQKICNSNIYSKSIFITRYDVEFLLYFFVIIITKRKEKLKVEKIKRNVCIKVKIYF